MMMVMRLYLLSIALFLFSFVQERAPYRVYYADKGVVLLSVKHGPIKNPVRGIEVYNGDLFDLPDERSVVRIKDITSGEIYGFSGKGKVSPKDIINSQKLNFFSRFLSFLSFTAKQNGFDTAPKLTSQCVIDKGDGGKSFDKDMSADAISQVKRSLENNRSDHRIKVSELLSKEDEIAVYRVHNIDTIDYAFVVYSVDENGEIYNHNRVVIKETYGFRSDNIAFIPLLGNETIDLTYFTFDPSDQRTCYILVFKPSKYYIQKGNGKYTQQIDWNLVSRELRYLGDTNMAILLE